MVSGFVKRHDRGMITRVMWVALVLAACGGGKGKGPPAPDPATATGPGPGGLLACQAAVRAIDALNACAPTPDEREMSALMTARLRAMSASTEPLPADRVAMMAQHCVAMLEEFGESLRWSKCSYAFTDHERQWVESWRTRRTGVPAGADEATRVSLAAAIDPRDRACACTTLDCAETIEGSLEKVIKPLPANARDVDRDAGGHILDELQACRRRLEWAAAHASPPPPPGDPAVVKRGLMRLRADAAADRAREAEKAKDDEEAGEGGGFEDDAVEDGGFEDFEDELAEDEDQAEEAP